MKGDEQTTPRCLGGSEQVLRRWWVVFFLCGGGSSPPQSPLALGSCPLPHLATPGAWAYIDGAPREGLHAEMHFTIDGSHGHPGVGRSGQ